jgi:hypothetical protein
MGFEMVVVEFGRVWAFCDSDDAVMDILWDFWQSLFVFSLRGFV